MAKGNRRERYFNRWPIGKGPAPCTFDDSARISDMMQARCIQRRVPFQCGNHGRQEFGGQAHTRWYEWFEPGEHRRVKCSLCGAWHYHTEPVGDWGLND